MPTDQRPTAISSFGFCHSFVIGYSSFVICFGSRVIHHEVVARAAEVRMRREAERVLRLAEPRGVRRQRLAQPTFERGAETAVAAVTAAAVAAAAALEPELVQQAMLAAVARGAAAGGDTG